MKILVVKLHALGDVVIHSPAFGFIREGFPEAHISMLTTDWAAPAAEGLPFFDELIIIPSILFFKRSIKSFGKLGRLSFDLRKKRFDYFVSFHRSRAINSFLRVSGADNRLFSYANRNSNRTVYLDETRHSAPNAVDLAGLVVSEVTGRKKNPTFDSLRYTWIVRPNEMEQARTFLKTIGIKDHRIALIFPGGGSNPRSFAPEKRWNIKGFIGLAEWLSKEKDFDVLLSGSKDDSALCHDIESQADCRTFDISGKLDIRTMAALMSLSRLTITNDSAPLHISAAVGTPTIGIFGPTGIEHKLPPGGNSFGVKLGMACSPCYYSVFKGCQFSSIRCMDELPLSTVTDTAEKLLNRLESPVE